MSKDKEYLNLLHENEIAKKVSEWNVSENYFKWRDSILNTYSDIIFIEDSHKYFLDSQELVPVTTMIHNFVEKADWDTIRARVASNMGISPDELKKLWDIHNMIATNSGTHVHEYAESCFYFYSGLKDSVLPSFKRQIERGFFLPNSPKEIAAAKFWTDMINTPGIVPMLSETRVYSAHIDGLYPYAGTFDLLMYYRNPNTGVEGVIIMDYKTNESLINDYSREHGKMLLPPFEDLIEESLSEYILQLGAYQIPIERELGIPILGRRIIYLKADGNYEMLKVDNVANRLFDALVDLNNKRFIH